LALLISSIAWSSGISSIVPRSGPAMKGLRAPASSASSIARSSPARTARASFASSIP